MTPEEFASAADVSRETLHRLLVMDGFLIDWSERHNLIARSTMKTRWHRHYLDSAQIVPLLPTGTKSIVDLGAGAGFPGLVLAAMLAKKDVHVLLIESVGKKAAFLNAAIAAMGLENAKVLHGRIEETTLAKPPDIIVARALAPLNKLLGYAQKIAGPTTRLLLLKGQDVEGELTEAAKSWHMEVKRHPSRTDPGGVILEIGNLALVSKT